MKIRRLFIPVTLGLGLIVVLLLGAGWQTGAAAVEQASEPHQPHATTYYVSLDGACGGQTPCYTTVQAAVDALDDPGDEIWVATGVYTGVNGYGGLSQMVYTERT